MHNPNINWVTVMSQSSAYEGTLSERGKEVKSDYVWFGWFVHNKIMDL